MFSHMTNHTYDLFHFSKEHKINFWQVLSPMYMQPTKSWSPSVADPGFPVGGAWTSNVGAFWQKCMQK